MLLYFIYFKDFTFHNSFFAMALKLAFALTTVGRSFLRPQNFGQKKWETQVQGHTKLDCQLWAINKLGPNKRIHKT